MPMLTSRATTWLRSRVPIPRPITAHSAMASDRQHQGPRDAVAGQPGLAAAGHDDRGGDEHTGGHGGDAVAEAGQGDDHQLGQHDPPAGAARRARWR